MSETGGAIRALVVDDELPARRRIRRLLERDEEIECVGEAADGGEALEAIRELKPDLVFLDIRMPGISGIEVVRELDPGEAPTFVMVTAYDQYALDAFEVAALDYLVKPFDDARFGESLQRAKGRVRSEKTREEHERLMEILSGHPSARRGGRRVPGLAESPWLERLGVEARGRVHIVRTKDIDYIAARGNYARIHVGSDAHLMRESLTNLESQLDPAMFARIHRSTLVNLERVATVRRKSYGDCVAILEDETELRVSRSYRKALAEALGIEI